MVTACSKNSPIKRSALWDLKNKKKSRMKTVFFYKGHQKHRPFSWPYVEPPSKSATASNNLSSDDDAIEIVQQQKIDNRTFDLTKVSKAEQSGYITTPVKMVTFV